MRHQDFLEWQFQNGLDDTWWLAIGGHVAQRQYSLLEIKALKESSPDSYFAVLHAVYSKEANPEWMDYDLHDRGSIRPSIPHKNNLVAQDFVVSPRPSTSGVIVAGAICAFVSLIFLPPAFGLAALVCGIIALAKGNVAGGIGIIILAVTFAGIGMLLGAYLMSR